MELLPYVVHMSCHARFVCTQLSCVSQPKFHLTLPVAPAEPVAPRLAPRLLCTWWWFILPAPDTANAAGAMAGCLAPAATARIAAAAASSRARARRPP